MQPVSERQYRSSPGLSAASRSAASMLPTVPAAVTFAHVTSGSTSVFSMRLAIAAAPFQFMY
ncbi:hypothetical protein [Paenibacillus vietnamensis]|uniref:hypothetical protein n=1 Tax=Paenibacillus vietnamensis TaxID=2590547 RepID=UPI001CD0B994|nr:hypothetical protein [Paenibacillus vietnamensis]